jgi:hypothetical protein
MSGVVKMCENIERVSVRWNVWFFILGGAVFVGCQLNFFPFSFFTIALCLAIVITSVPRIPLLLLRVHE